jgi:hypothetical protein
VCHPAERVSLLQREGERSFNQLPVSGAALPHYAFPQWKALCSEHEEQDDDDDDQAGKADSVIHETPPVRRDDAIPETGAVYADAGLRRTRLTPWLSPLMSMRR